MADVYYIEELRRKKRKRDPDEVRLILEGGAPFAKIYECLDCGFFCIYAIDDPADKMCPECGSRNYEFLGWGE